MLRRTMTKRCFILGAGPTKELLGEYRPPMFCISPNMHYPGADLIFAMDDPVIKELLKKPQGFENQLIFTTPQKYKHYHEIARITKFAHLDHFDEKRSFSSGGNAIGLATLMRFDEIYLLGMDWTDPALPDNVDQDYIKCLMSIAKPEHREYTPTYIKIDTKDCDSQPWFDKIITMEEFKNIR